MSTVIRNGVLILEKDTFKLFRLFSEWREQVAEMMLSYETEWTAREAARILDKRIWNDEPTGKILSEVRDDWNKRRKEIVATRRRDPDVDTDFNIAVMPTRIGLFGWRKALVAMVFTERSDWLKSFRDLPWVKEYAYWDNTDPPDGVSEKKWRNRRKAWDTALDRDSRPGQCGFTVECLSRHHWVNPDAILAAFPTFEKRCSNLAYNIALSQHSLPKKEDGEQYELSEMIEHHFKFMDWVETDEGKAALAEIAARVAEKIPADVTEEMILGWNRVQVDENLRKVEELLHDIPEASPAP